MKRDFVVLVFAALSTLTASALSAQELPSDYGVDLQLGLNSHASLMAGAPEITGSQFNEVGDEVFGRLVATGFDIPFPWKLTLVGNGVVNAGSSAAGQVYVYGGMLDLIGENKGLWAAVLSHEVSHTGLRHQVRVYLQLQYNQRMIEYYRLRAANGDKSANWALLAFVAASKIALKKLEREQEHEADSHGMLLMAHAGYHPDFVFALHHILLMRTGEQSKFAAFFSDHPRWETRDQRSEKSYADALAEYNRLWPDPALSPGGNPPVVAFLTEPTSRANAQSGTADVSVPVSCRNATEPVNVVLMFEKDSHPVQANDERFADKDGNLVFSQKADCSEKDSPAPISVEVPDTAVSNHDRSVKATVIVIADGGVIASSKAVNVQFPKAKQASLPVTAKKLQKSAPPSPPVPSESNTQTSAAQNVPTALALAPETLKTSAADVLSAIPITSDPSGAEVYADDSFVGKTPTILKLRPGHHYIRMFMTNYKNWSQQLAVEAGSEAHLAATLEKAN